MNDLQSVQALATKLGISYHHRAGVAKIQTAIDAFYVENPVTQANTGGLVPQVHAEGIEITPETTKFPGGHVLTKREYTALMRKQTKLRVGALKRVRIQNMNPMKKEWNGELISVGSARLGTFKKFIPFDGKPYHVPKIIYDVMVERQCSVFYTEKNERGQSVRKSRLIPEYVIQDLDPLTPEELKDLAQAQAMHGTGL